MKTVFIFSLIIVLFSSCKKEKDPEIETFYSVKSSLLAWNECAAISDIIIQRCDNYNQWFQTGMTIQNVQDSSFSIQFTNSLMDDKHKRSGSLNVQYFGLLNKDTNKVIVDLINYKTNSIQVSGQLIFQENTTTFGIPMSGKNAYAITGTLTFLYVNGKTTTATFNLNRQTQYDSGTLVNGSVTGVNQNGDSFSSNSVSDIKRGSYFQNLSSSYPVFYNGKYELTEGTKTGFVWYGYKDQCDNYGFTEWADSKFNFYLEDY
jgi:hypothetical protein